MTSGGDPGPAEAGPRWTALEVPLAALGLHPSRRRQLAALDLRTVQDVIRHLPRRYEDRSRVWPLGEIRAPGTYAAEAEVRSVAQSQPRPGLTVLRARLQDGSGSMDALWFNQRYLRARLRPGAALGVYGPVVAGPGGRLVFRAPDAEPAAEAPQGIVAVYPLAAGVSQGTLRRASARALERFAAAIPAVAPPGARAELGLLAVDEAWRQLHRPSSAEALAAARRALCFEQLLPLQLAVLLRREARAGARRGYAYAPPGALCGRLAQRLPFTLTVAQRRVLAEIDADLAGPRPMQRLVQGDVGCGKTVIAASAMLRAVESGLQAVLLAPTELLAQQHAAALKRLYGELCAVEVLTGATPAAQRRRLVAELGAGRAPVVVGTHALLQEDVRLPRLGLAVTDEQHRFGVRQREALAAKGATPDVLVLSATPIPRTLAMTLYGDLDVSVIDERPPGRGRVRTLVREPGARAAVYGFVRGQIAAGRQAYVVCPRLGDAQEAPDAEAPGEEPEPAAAQQWARRLAGEMPEVHTQLLHGRMAAAASAAVLAAFAAGRVQLRVCTTVIEVGIDVPNATLMVVEDADRFGLAQLHQLRGRVGRGPDASYCVLIARGAAERLRVLERTADGFAIAEEDLRQRGPGELLGTRQHGLPETDRAVEAADELQLLAAARRWALRIRAADPSLQEPGHAALRAAAGLPAHP